jgi:8-oxo-dGTP pyrophosphatase MutT (NUDIX family)
VPAPSRPPSPFSGDTLRSAAPSDTIGWPEYCCAILIDADDRYLIERRPERAADAPGQLACFGGKREKSEHPDRCIRREIKEELGWSVGALRLRVAVRLRERASGREIAWFYAGRGPREGLKLSPLPGSTILRLSQEEVVSAPDLSLWHRAAIETYIRGDGIAWVDAKSSVG